MQVLITVLSLLIMSVNNHYCSSESKLSPLKSATEAMERLMAYLNQHHSYIIDLLFGVVLVKGQLSTLSRHLALKPWFDQSSFQEHLRQWINECNEIYYYSSPIIERETSVTILQNVIKPDIWELDNNITLGLLKEPTGHWRKGSAYWQSKPPSELRAKGAPNEEQSDLCIAELTTCKLSNKCWKIMTDNDKSTGYSVTHRLLYFQVARQLHCLNSTLLVDAQHRILDFCSNIYQETKNLYEIGLPIGLRDLFIEQIVLCGLEGFGEFLDPKWLKEILTWQAPQGCFSEVPKQEQKMKSPLTTHNYKLHYNSRVKRYDQHLDEDCTMHITGLAAAALSLFLRAFLE